MKPVLGADAQKRNWLNYKTGVRDLYFRMNADRHSASIAIEMRQADAAERQQQFEKLLALRSLLEQFTGEVWIAGEGLHDENGAPYNRLGAIFNDVSIFRKEDWPALISFFKPRIIALDAFWDLVKDQFT